MSHHWYWQDAVFERMFQKSLPFMDPKSFIAKTQAASPYIRLYLDSIPRDQIREMETQGYLAITNSILKGELAKTEHVLKMNNSVYGSFYYPYPTRGESIDKDFNCLMNRMDPFRQSWLYQLVRNGLFDRGYISFNMDIDRVDHVQGLTQTQAFEKQFQEYCSIFADEHKIVKDLVPYKNFTDNGDITHVIMNSKVTLILETYFSDNDNIVYSEKTFRSLQLPRPWMLFGARHAVKELKHIGFDILDDLVDHEYYDNFDQPVERQSAILSLMKDLINLDLNPYHDRLESAARYNQNILLEYSKTQAQDFLDLLQQAKIKIEQLRENFTT